MSKFVTPAITADGSTQELAIYNRPNGGGESVVKGVYAVGTFGGGTATLEQSVDGGVTWITVQNNGTDVTFTETQGERLSMPSDGLEPIKLRLTLAGSTSPSLAMYLYDAG